MRQLKLRGRTAAALALRAAVRVAVRAVRVSALLACSVPAPALACDTLDNAGPLAAQVLAAVNALREARGLPLLQADAQLQAIACAHSRALATRGGLTHDGFDERLLHSGRSRCVENLAAGFRQAAPLLRAWQASSAHAHNLVEPGVDRAGVGVAGPVVALFACSTGLAPPGAAISSTVPAQTLER